MLMGGFTVSTVRYDGSIYVRTYTSSGVANAAASRDMENPFVVSVEVRDNVSGRAYGKSKPVAVPDNIPSPEPTDDFNREYDIAPWEYDR